MPVVTILLFSLPIESSFRDSISNQVFMPLFPTASFGASRGRASLF
jgi:hypothetical protein